MDDMYKTLEIPFAAGLTGVERELIGELDRAFPSEDIILECGDDMLLVHLRALDLAAFDETVRELVIKHDLQGKTPLEH